MLITGYHGTTSRAAHLTNASQFKIGANSRPKWLGPGVYFFQDAPHHAQKWAEQLSSIRKEPPVVFAATVDLSNCLDLMDIEYWSYFRQYLNTAAVAPKAQVGPSAITSPGTTSKHLGWNYEDDFHIQRFITLLEVGRTVSSVRCPFIEGNQLYNNSWFFDEAHVAICVRDPNIVSDLRIVDFA